MKNSVKKITAAALCTVLIAGSVGITAFAENKADSKGESASVTEVEEAKTTAESSSSDKSLSGVSKDETVYVLVDAEGKTKKIIVSDWLKNSKQSKEIKDYSELKDVENVKGDEEYTMGGDNTRVWDADGNDIYYQGNSTEQLPVTMQITYELDGQQLSQEELKGKSGHLKINIHLTNVNSETKTINGKNVIIHPFYVAGGMLSLNNDHYSNATCDQGKIVTDGSKQMLVFAAVPGLKDTLDSADLSKVSDQLSIGDDINIECDVTDCDELNLMMGM